MTRLVEVVYQVVALLAMLAHLLIVGPLCLLTLVMTIPPGSELIGLALKAIVVVMWFGLGYLGLQAWKQKSWWVIVIPIVSFCLVLLVLRVGTYAIDWFLIGY
jgi:hypothetical protein